MADEDRGDTGLRMIDAVLGAGFSAHFDDTDDPYLRDTADHLFGEIWSRPGLDLRDRRLLTLGVLAALGQGDAFGVHAAGALSSGDLTADQLREAVLHLAYYAGSSNATTIRRSVSQAIDAHRAG